MPNVESKTVYTVGDKQFDDLEEARAHAHDLIVREEAAAYAEARGITGRAASRLVNTISSFEAWKQARILSEFQDRKQEAA